MFPYMRMLTACRNYQIMLANQKAPHLPASVDAYGVWKMSFSSLANCTSRLEGSRLVVMSTLGSCHHTKSLLSSDVPRSASLGAMVLSGKESCNGRRTKRLPQILVNRTHECSRRRSAGLVQAASLAGKVLLLSAARQGS